MTFQISLKETVEELLPEIPKRIQTKIHIISASRRNREKADYEDMIQTGMLAWLDNADKSRKEREASIGRAISRLCYSENRGHASLSENFGDLMDVIEQDDLRESLANLPELHSDVLSCYYLQGQTYSQIGRKYGKSGQWTKRCIQKSLERLKDEMGRS